MSGFPFGSSSFATATTTTTASFSFGSSPSPPLVGSCTAPSTGFSFPTSPPNPNSSFSSPPSLSFSVPLFSSTPTPSFSGTPSSSSAAASTPSHFCASSSASPTTTTATPLFRSTSVAPASSAASSASPFYGAAQSAASTPLCGTPAASSAASSAAPSAAPLVGASLFGSTASSASSFPSLFPGSSSAPPGLYVAPLSTHTLQLTVCHHTHPPPAAEVSLQNKVENRNIAEGTVTFHGYTVPSCLLHPLEQLQEIEGDFWSKSVCLDTEATNNMMALLGKAAGLLDRTWSSLSKAELKYLISSVNAGCAFNFGLNEMKLIADEAQKILDCSDIIERRERLKAELKEVELEIKQRLGSRNLDLAVKSFVKPE